MGAAVRRVVLKPGHVQPVWAGHPWIYAQGIERTDGHPAPGDVVTVVDARGNELGSGLYSPRSAIAVRLFSREAGASFDHALLTDRLSRAGRRREQWFAREGGGPTSSFRLVYAEGDDLPGLVVDRFDDVLVVQLGTIGLAQRRQLVLDALREVFAPAAILDRTTVRVAQAEGFELGERVAFGAEPKELKVVERGLELRLPSTLTQKTGFYFDQRPLRARIEQIASGLDVLDAYSYVGAVGLFAKRGGARSVVSVDTSEHALTVGKTLSNELGLEVRFERADAEKFLLEAARGYDMVIADPPKFAYSRAMQGKAERAFRRVAGLAVGATRPGGVVVLSSCSAALGLGEVERALALGAADVGRRTRIFDRVFQGADHPVPAQFPEGLYLSSVLGWVD